MTDPLYELQLVYLSTGEGLDLIYTNLLRLGATILAGTCREKGLLFNEDRREQIIHDASTNFIEYNYLTNKRHITHFYTKQRFYIYQQLGWAPRGRFGKLKQWDKLHSIDLCLEELHHPTFTDIEEPKTYIREFKDRNIWIPYYLYKHKSFEVAIRAIILVGGERWTRTNWNKLHMVHTVLKRKSNLGDSLKIYCKSLKKKQGNGNLDNLLS